VGTAQILAHFGQGILFLDELTSAPQMTQAGCYQLVLDRRLDEYRLPDEWVVIAAGIPASERGVHFAMPRPLRNRFVHLDLEPDCWLHSNAPTEYNVMPPLVRLTIHFYPATPKEWCWIYRFAAGQPKIELPDFDPAKLWQSSELGVTQELCGDAPQSCLRRYNSRE